LLVNIVLSVTFIHFWGIEGVAFATFIAFAAEKIIYVVYNKMMLKVSPGKYIPVSILAVYSVITLVTFYIMY